MSDESARPSALELLDRHFVENGARFLELAVYSLRLNRYRGAVVAYGDFRPEKMGQIHCVNPIEFLAQPSRFQITW